METSALSEDAKAILLLCGVFGDKEKTGDGPLSLTEYNRLASWLKDNGYRPRDLVAGEAFEALHQESAVGFDLARVERLLARGAAVAFAIERWMNKGSWVVCRSDVDYPGRLRAHLGKQAPPILYGFGDRQLLSAGGLAVVGSRNVDQEGAEFASEAARHAAREGMSIVSGGARGVDQVAMKAALEEGGKAVGVMASNLLRSALRPDARNAIRSARLTLISPYHPEAGFNVGNAMDRNKLIYAIGDLAVVVSAEFEKGGTWAGAVEELRRRGHVPVFVRVSTHSSRGNSELLKLGALPFPAKPWSAPFSELLASAAREENAACRKPVQGELFGPPSPEIDGAASEAKGMVREPPEPGFGTEGVQIPPRTVFEAILPVLLRQLERPHTAADLAKAMDVQKTQLDKWLKEAIRIGAVKKLARPVRFIAASAAGEGMPAKE
jgi:predicted Rossmann fold nucleotide-binding protein DprA/Smf involved in DNA uptake